MGMRIENKHVLVNKESPGDTTGTPQLTGGPKTVVYKQAALRLVLVDLALRRIVLLNKIMFFRYKTPEGKDNYVDKVMLSNNGEESMVKVGVCNYSVKCA